MKSYILCLGLTISFLPLIAQQRVGISLGGHIAGFREASNTLADDSVLNNYDKKPGVHAGFLADLPFANGRVAVQPGVFFYQRGYKYAANPNQDPGLKSETRSLSLNYVDLPVSLVYKAGKKTKLVIGAGGYGSFLLSGSTKEELFYNPSGYTLNINKNLQVGKRAGAYRGFDYGVLGKLGVEGRKAQFTIDGTAGMGDFANEITDEKKHYTLGATLTFFLGKPAPAVSRVKDQDKDGVADDQDQCPGVAGSAATNGCPDTDLDGFADNVDPCPTVFGSFSGCPDTDGDGVPDQSDSCRSVAGSRAYSGCPIPDTDKDGINDEEDQCKTVPGTAKYDGCPVPDRDRDGVNDERDRCPDTPGTNANSGCPEVEETVKQSVNVAASKIQFAKSSDALTPEAKTALVKLATLLNQNPSLQLSIEGHTSNTGNRDINLLLSEKRAQAVKAFLEAQGVSGNRMTAKGFGPDQPLPNNSNAALNRRVELKPFY